MSQSCPDDSAPFIDSYLQYAIVTPITLLMQSLLIYNSIKHYKELKKIDIKIRTLYFSTQIATTLFLLIEFLKTIVLSHNKQSHLSLFYCNLSSYNPMFAIFCYFLLLLYLFYRLDFTFKNSAYRLSVYYRVFLALFLCIPPFASIIIFPILAGDACIWDWFPFDGHLTKTPHIYICATNYTASNGAIDVVYVCIVWTTIMNIAVALLFYSKLKQLLDDSGGGRANKNTMKTKRLMMKNTILTICCVASTLISWVLWLIFNMVTYGKSIVYIDLWLNGFCIALMFKFNEKYYKRLCGRCTKCFITEEQLKINIGILDESTRTGIHTPQTHEPIVSDTNTNTQRTELTVNTKEITLDETKNHLMGMGDDTPQAVITTDDENENDTLP